MCGGGGGSSVQVCVFPNAGVEPVGFLLPSGSNQDRKTFESTCKCFLTHLPHSAAAPESAAMVLFCATEGKRESGDSVHLEAYCVNLSTFQKSPLQVEVTQVTQWMSRELVSVSLAGSLSTDIRLSQLSGTPHAELLL